MFQTDFTSVSAPRGRETGAEGFHGNRHPATDGTLAHHLHPLVLKQNDSEEVLLRFFFLPCGLCYIFRGKNVRAKVTPTNVQYMVHFMTIGRCLYVSICTSKFRFVNHCNNWKMPVDGAAVIALDLSSAQLLS